MEISSERETSSSRKTILDKHYVEITWIQINSNTYESVIIFIKMNARGYCSISSSPSLAPAVANSITMLQCPRDLARSNAV